MEHDALARQLTDFLPRSATEADAVHAARRLLIATHDPFGTDGQQEHLTASALVFDGVGADRILLHRHRRLHRWLQPGGHIDPGETPAQAALRECLEETGCVATHSRYGGLLINVDHHPGPRGHLHVDLRYLVTADPLQPLRPRTGESHHVRWWPVTQLPEPVDDSLKEAITAGLAWMGRTT